MPLKNCKETEYPLKSVCKQINTKISYGIVGDRLRKQVGAVQFSLPTSLSKPLAGAQHADSRCLVTLDSASFVHREETMTKSLGPVHQFHFANIAFGV